MGYHSSSLPSFKYSILFSLAKISLNNLVEHEQNKGLKILARRLASGCRKLDECVLTFVSLRLPTRQSGKDTEFYPPLNDWARSLN